MVKSRNQFPLQRQTTSVPRFRAGPLRIRRRARVGSRKANPAAPPQIQQLHRRCRSRTRPPRRNRPRLRRVSAVSVSRCGLIGHAWPRRPASRWPKKLLKMATRCDTVHPYKPTMTIDERAVAFAHQRLTTTNQQPTTNSPCVQTICHPRRSILRKSATKHSPVAAQNPGGEF